MNKWLVPASLSVLMSACVNHPVSPTYATAGENSMNGTTAPEIARSNNQAQTSAESTPKLLASLASKTSAELVTNLSYDGEDISLVVSSNGCTRAEDFAIQHEIREGTCLVSVVRTKQDSCRKAPHPVRIAIAWTKPIACEGLPLVFTNPLLEFQKSAVSR